MKDEYSQEARSERPAALSGGEAGSRIKGAA
jgi:hypothetical protein